MASTSFQSEWLVTICWQHLSSCLVRTGHADVREQPSTILLPNPSQQVLSPHNNNLGWSWIIQDHLGAGFPTEPHACPALWQAPWSGAHQFPSRKCSTDKENTTIRNPFLIAFYIHSTYSKLLIFGGSMLHSLAKQHRPTQISGAWEWHGYKRRRKQSHLPTADMEKWKRKEIVDSNPNQKIMEKHCGTGLFSKPNETENTSETTMIVVSQPFGTLSENTSLVWSQMARVRKRFCSF